ncbi:MAG: glycosyltransferase [Pseudomonadota bacterium]
MTDRARVAAVAIGRNEGDRLAKCLASLTGQVGTIVYVDSGSSDGSLDVAREAGADVVELDMSRPFTAARARNAGAAHLRSSAPPEFIQFIDGDCELDPDWIPAAVSWLDQHRDLAVVCGRRRERHPQASLYNCLIDAEWDTPLGEARACGGDAMIRFAAFQDVDGYNPALIAGEEPELCVRLRQAGWRIWRLDAEMTRHDAAMTRFSQWWARARRAGHAYAEGAHLHGAPPERHGVVQKRRALMWGAGLPLAIIVATLITPWMALALLAWPLQTIRLIWRGETPIRAVFLSLSKFPEAQGVIGAEVARRMGRGVPLIEYK